MPITITTPAPTQHKPRTESKPMGSTASISQQRFLRITLNGSKADEPAGVLAGS